MRGQEFCQTYIITIRSVEIIRFFERDVGIGDNASVMQVVETGDVWKQTVKEEGVAFLRYDRGELLAVLDTSVCITSGQARFESFWMVIQISDNV